MTNDPVKKWFSTRRFGLFLHFGLYSIEGWHEQDQMRRRIPRAEYRQLIDRFNPLDFDAEEILDYAEAVGMQYVCLTTKHHDGFCLWDTKYSDFNVMNSLYGKDIVKQLADACHKRNFSLGLYYSVADWHQPNYPNQGRHHELPGPAETDEPDWDLYMDFVKQQVTELCTNYGEIRHFFWDINVPKHRDPSVNAMLRKLQPNIVINDRGFDEGDFGTPERDYDDGENNRLIKFPRPTEACNSLGSESWGYRANENYYSIPFLINSIDGYFAKGANYLLNIGPDASGKLPEKSLTILKEIGSWYNNVREAFDNTEPASDLTTNTDVFLTGKDNNLFVHIPVPAKAESVILAPITRPPIKAILLNTGLALSTSTNLLPMYWESEAKFLTITDIPVNEITDRTLVIKLEFTEPITSSSNASAEFIG